MKTNEKLKAIIAYLCSGLIGREEHARMLLLAALAGENIILFGPPGTAKSELARRLRHCFTDDLKYFECLLTKFSMPEEVFGPISLKSLENDRYERIYHGHLPGANIAFIDETFKANSAILNSMLTIMNEREFDTGSKRVPVDLLTVVGASNEMPAEAELAALYDRFVVRMKVMPLSSEKDLHDFLLSDFSRTTLAEEAKLTVAEVMGLRKLAANITVTTDVIQALAKFKTWCDQNDTKLSDRRLRKIRDLIKMAAATSHRKETILPDLLVLQHCGWADYNSKQDEQIRDWLSATIEKQEVSLTAIKARLTVEQEVAEEKSMVHKKNSDGKLLYLDPTSGQETPQSKPAEPMYIYAHGKSGKDDNKGAGYSKEKIIQMLMHDHRAGYGNVEVPGYNNYAKDVREVFDDLYAKKRSLIVNTEFKPAMTDAIYTDAQIAKFVLGPRNIVTETRALIVDVVEKRGRIQGVLGQSPWIPDAFIGAYSSGLEYNHKECLEVIAGAEVVLQRYDGFLRSKDPAKLSDPKA